MEDSEILEHIISSPSNKTDDAKDQQILNWIVEFALASDMTSLEQTIQSHQMLKKTEERTQLRYALNNMLKFSADWKDLVQIKRNRSKLLNLTFG